MLRFLALGLCIGITATHGGLTPMAVAQDDPPQMRVPAARASRELSSADGRVNVHRRGNLATVRSGDGRPLHGISLSVFQYRRDQLRQAGQYPEGDYLYDDAYWDSIADLGINAVRLAFFDPWQRSHGDAGSSTPYPHADLWDDADVNDMLRDIDQAVAQAAQRGLVLMINYHDTGGYRDPIRGVAGEDRQFPYGDTMRYCERFWDLVAARYHSRRHVFYELTNEPVQWHPNDYTSTDTDHFAALYKKVRAVAPETHVVLISAATPASWRADRTLLDLAKELEAKGVGFSNASIGFHPYLLADLDAGGNPCSPSRAQEDLIKPVIAVMRAGFPVLNTEQNFPDGVIPSDDPQAPPLLPGDTTGAQSMERLGISWFHWNTMGPEESGHLRRLIQGVTRPAAESFSPGMRRGLEGD